MSILVSCQCGKRFKTADQNAGKRAKCPGCGQPITVPAPAPVVQRPAERSADDDLLSLAEPEVFAPVAHVPSAGSSTKGTKKSAATGVPPQSKRDRSTGKAGVPSISISPGLIVLIVLAILIPAAIFWAKEGPMKTEAEWKVISENASENIGGQITRAIQHRYKEYGIDMTDMKFQPKADDAVLDSLGFMISMPDSVPFQGTSTEGHYRGTFHPKTWRFEAEAPLRTSKKELAITGSASETDQSLDIDGVPVKD